MNYETNINRMWSIIAKVTVYIDTNYTQSCANFEYKTKNKQTKIEGRAGKYKLRARAVKYKLWSGGRAVTGGQD